MGWLDKLRRKPKTKTKYAQMLNGYTPIYSQFGDDIYASDVVQQAINCIVMECKKLIPQHVKNNGSDVIPVNSDVQAVLNAPNEIMTTTDFIEKSFGSCILIITHLSSQLGTPGKSQTEA